MWYLVLSRRAVSMKDTLKRLPDFAYWMMQQQEEGRVLFSGPTRDRAVSIYVIRASSLEEAQRVAEEDPFHVHDLRSYEILEWEAHMVLGSGLFGENPARVEARERLAKA